MYKMKKLIIWSVAMTLLTSWCALHAEPSAEAKTERVLILVSSIGSGHISAARAIEERIKARDGKVVVDTLNIRQFDYKTERADKTDAKLYWYIVKNYPRLFTRLYKAAMNKGKQIPNLSSLLKTDLPALEKAIKNGGYDVVIAAHYGSASALSVLREQEKLNGVRLGWLNTDYILEYFHRFQVDKFFLGHEALTEEFRQAGVEDSRLATTGIPVSEKLKATFDAEAFRASVGLDPTIKTVVISAGAEGVANFTKMVSELSKQDRPLQIVTITGKNEKALNALKQMKIPSHVKLIPEGFIPIEKVVGYVRTADLYVTKSGGLMPTEAFTVGVPTILLDVYGGHESVNAELFRQQRMAEIVGDTYENFGEKAEKLLSNESARSEQLAAQSRFQKMQAFDKIADFVFDRNDKYLALGSLDGKRVSDPNGVQKTIDNQPAKLELLLSYAKGQASANDSNPFGHLALRVNDKVYTANGRAKFGVERDLVHTSSLSDYLYGVSNTTQNQEFTDAFGEAYGRSILGLRIHDIEPELLSEIEQEYEKVQREWRRGVTRWHNKENNCADITVRALEVAGLDKARPGITLPLTVYERFLEKMAKKYAGKIEVVKYEKVAGSQNTYKFDVFPMNLSNMLNRSKSQVAHENLVSSVVTYDPSEQALKIEKTGNGLSNEKLAEIEAEHKRLLEQAKRLERQEQDTKVLFEEALETRKEFVKGQREVRNLDLSSEQLEALGRGQRPSGLSDNALQTYNRASQSMKQFQTAVQKYHNHYDEVSRGKNELIMSMVKNDLDGLLTIAKSNPAMKAKKRAKLEKAYSEVVQLHNDYYAIRHHEGVNHKDNKRLKAINDFHKKAEQLSGELDSQIKGQTLMGRVKEMAAKLLGRVKAAIKTGSMMVKTLPEISRVVTALATSKGDFGTAVRDVWNKLSENSNLDVHHNTEAKPLPNRPIIYVLNHRNAMADHMAAYPGIKENNITFVTQAEGYGEPEFLRQRLLQNEGFAPVGHPKIDPVKRIVQSMNGGRTVIIYPEGSVSTLLGETRQIRPNFSKRLLPSLIENGKFQVIPVTIDDAAVRFGEKFDMAQTRKHINVTFHSPIKSETLKQLYAMDPKSDLPSQLLRLKWHREMTKEGEPLAGQMTVAEVLERVRTPYEKSLPQEMASTLPLRNTIQERNSSPLDAMEELALAEEGTNGFSTNETVNRDRVQSRLMDLLMEYRAKGDDNRTQEIIDVAKSVEEIGESGELSKSRVEQELAKLTWLSESNKRAIVAGQPVHAPTLERLQRELRRAQHVR